jgi:FtsZ-interacting cell division protein YlmF
MSVFSMAKNFFGVEESYADELPTREAIPINSRQGFRPAVVSRSKKAQFVDMTEIFTINVTSYQGDAGRIGEQYRDGKTVIVNLGDMSPAEARRVIDFIMGLTFALEGEARRVTEKVYLLAHAGVSIEGEDSAEDAQEADQLYIRP